MDVIVNNIEAMDYGFSQYTQAGQIIVVENKLRGDFQSRVSCYEKAPEGWKQVYSFDAVIGKAGIIDKEKKREGDNKTPAGVYTLGFVFGYDKKPDTKMEYVELTDYDKWIDDPEHPLYNHFVRGDTDARSFEKMRRDDNLYKLGLVINYNTNPVVKYRGSAIFLHIWKDYDTPTAGCIAISEEAIKSIITWLDPNKNPIIIINQAHTPL